MKLSGMRVVKKCMVGMKKMVFGPLKGAVYLGTKDHGHAKPMFVTLFFIICHPTNKINTTGFSKRHTKNTGRKSKKSFSLP